jgi:hypothetical protein
MVEGFQITVIQFLTDKKIMGCAEVLEVLGTRYSIILSQPNGTLGKSDITGISDPAHHRWSGHRWIAQKSSWLTP